MKVKISQTVTFDQLPCLNQMWWIQFKRLKQPPLSSSTMDGYAYTNAPHKLYVQSERREKKHLQSTSPIKTEQL